MNLKTTEKFGNARFDDMLSNLLKIQKSSSAIKLWIERIRNREILNGTRTFNEIPFLVRKKPDGLVIIENIEDHNSLTLEQAKTFLVGYGKSTDGDESDLKNNMAHPCGVPPSFFVYVSKKYAS